MIVIELRCLVLMLLLPVVLHRYSNECSFSFSFFQSLHAHSNGLQFFAWPCFRVYTCVWWAVANDKKKAEHLTLRTRITARLWHRVHSSSVFKLAVKSESEEPLWLTLGVCIIVYCTLFEHVSVCLFVCVSDCGALAVFQGLKQAICRWYDCVWLCLYVYRLRLAYNRMFQCACVSRAESNVYNTYRLH